MTRILKAFAGQLFGAKYESAGKSLLAAAALFWAVRATGLKLAIAPSVLYLTSVLFTAGVMWQTLSAGRHAETLRSMLALPFENRSFVSGYVSALSMHTLVTKTLPVWAPLGAAAPWNGFEIALAFLCGCMACTVTAAAYLMLRRGNAVCPVLWASGILAVILAVRRPPAILAAVLASLAGAALYLYSADAYDFYNACAAKKPARHMGYSGNMLVYLARYMMANKSHGINTAGLCAVACLLPLPLGNLQELNALPIGFAILCLNTPVCTLLSGDPDLEQAVRALPGQARHFGRMYCLFILAVNGAAAVLYLCIWQMIQGGVGPADIGTAILFATQSAILSAVLEWKHPIRGWKTESDLWHHPRKYLVPLVMLLIAAFIGTWPRLSAAYAAILLPECCALLYMTRRS
ncbi:MAG: hypothetical protein Q4F18_11605 [Clostridia bacterium]|nr:hypothetical protein [Clostridia bacterium]